MTIITTELLLLMIFISLIGYIVFYYKLRKFSDRISKLTNINNSFLTADIDNLANESQATSYKHASVEHITHLPNRSFITTRISRLIKQQASEKQRFAVMILDLNNFNEITSLSDFKNSEVLIEKIAQRLLIILPDEDYLIRVRVDEFAIVVTKFKTNNQLNKIVNKILLAFSDPFSVNNKFIFVTVCLGISLYPEHTECPEQLLNYADTAMYKLKKDMQIGHQFYEPDLSLQSLERSELDFGLRNAIIKNQLELYYQPQIDLNSKKMVCAEALLRWKHPSLGMIPPDKFIKLAEQSGLIVEIGYWVLKTAFEKVVYWNTNGNNETVKLAVNLSPRQFVNNDMVASIKSLIKETNCKPEWIKLEITEGLLLNKSDEILIALIQLSDLGFEWSIDDFGTGYSALSYLTRYPISQIKIDRSFIMDIPIDLEKCELVKIIIKIAKILHLSLVAEGVETQEQVDFLMKNECQFVQGYYFSKPLPLNAFEDKLREINCISSIEDSHLTHIDKSALLIN